MKISLSRTEYVAKKIGKLNGDKILDIGCRDMILKKSLEGKFNYTGIDYTKEKKEESDYINHNLEKGLPHELSNFDIIIALDVLEHLENIHELYQQLFLKTNRILVVALPNMGHYKFRLNFLFNASISGKYIFTEKKITDRHRWLPNFETINKFVISNTPKNFNIKSYNFIFVRKSNFLFFYAEKILSKVFPSLFVYEKIYIFTNKTNL